eukprot:Rhum_TRINITY_DN14800_c6_g2::Rhum_TRINITY_DN14800_c6_g2_i1::g.121203::m.121203
MLAKRRSSGVIHFIVRKIQRAEIDALPPGLLVLHPHQLSDVAVRLRHVRRPGRWGKGQRRGQPVDRRQRRRGGGAGPGGTRLARRSPGGRPAGVASGADAVRGRAAVGWGTVAPVGVADGGEVRLVARVDEAEQGGREGDAAVAPRRRHGLDDLRVGLVHAAEGHVLLLVLVTRPPQLAHLLRLLIDARAQPPLVLLPLHLADLARLLQALPLRLRQLQSVAKLNHLSIQRLAAARPDLLAHRRVVVLQGRHPGRQDLVLPGQRVLLLLRHPAEVLPLLLDLLLRTQQIVSALLLLAQLHLKLVVLLAHLRPLPLDHERAAERGGELLLPHDAQVPAHLGLPELQLAHLDPQRLLLLLHLLLRLLSVLQGVLRGLDLLLELVADRLLRLLRNLPVPGRKLLRELLLQLLHLLLQVRHHLVVRLLVLNHLAHDGLRLLRVPERADRVLDALLAGADGRDHRGDGVSTQTLLQHPREHRLAVRGDLLFRPLLVLDDDVENLAKRRQRLVDVLRLC